VKVSEFLVLAKDWKKDNDPIGYWISEKFDGMRAYWDGHKLYSKQGVEIKAPKEFTANFPEQTLDGELWYVIAILLPRLQCQTGLNWGSMSIL
jgi:DNA ligase-1